MDTSRFFKKILPTTGIRFLAEWVTKPDHPKGGYFIHFPYGEDSDDDMATRAASISAKGGNVYFACASYKEVIYKVTPGGKEFPAGRTQDNAAHMRAFWLDVDVGKDDSDKSYPTQREAAAAVVRLVSEVGLPVPMLIASGAGLHVYWPLTENIDASRWTAVASQLKSICTHLGIRVDPSRTADSASVLRPVGTMNPKHKKAVRLLRDADAGPAGAIAAPIADYILSHHVSHTRRDNVSGPSLNAALIGAPVEYPPSHADEIVRHCAVLANFHDKLGNVAEPFWYAALGLLKHCVDGETLAHEWSSGHPSYDAHVTQNKIEQWTVGPPLCSKMESESGLNLCKLCPHYGKVKTPIQLGHAVPAAHDVVVAIPASQVEATVVDTSVHMPEGYSWRNDTLYRTVEKDGVAESIPFSDTLFYPLSRVRDESGEWSLRMRMSVSGHYWREFDVPMSLIPDPRGFAKHLAKYEIIIFGITHAMSYTKDYLHSLRKLNVQLITYDRFGWDEDRFIVGSTAFLSNGTTEPVLVTENVEKSRRAFDNTPVGNVTEWADLIDRAYNRPNAEKYQFVIATAFASPLIALANFDNYKGIPVALSGEGGIGKSSICKAAATVFARPEAIMIDASEKNGATVQALFSMASMYNGVPLLMDEMTERSAADFPPLMYSLSNGMGKLRMTSGGKFADTVKAFSGIKWITSNNNLTDDIYSAEKQQVAEAVEARCFEIANLSKAEMDATFAGTDMKDLLEHQLFPHHHGVAAQVYLPYVMKNRNAVINLIRKTRTRLGNDTAAESRERYYIDTIAFAFVGATIAGRLGLIRWDVKQMTKWAIDHLKTLRRNFSERASTSGDKVSSFFSWLHGSTIVTRNFPQGRPKSDEFEVPNDQLRKSPKARVAHADRKMLIRVDAINEWCTESNVSPSQFKELLKREGYILGERLEYIAKGTHVMSGRARCYELDYNRIVGVTTIVTDGKVSKIVPPDGMSQKVSQ